MHAVAKPIPRENVLRLQHALGQFPQVNMPVKHYFARGVYAREIFIPAGTCIVGKIHKHSQINILSKGDISVTTDTGIVRVQAPYTVVGAPGTKRVGYAHTDVIWTTISGTNETDTQKIEEELIATSFEAYEQFAREALSLNGGQLCLGQ